MDRFAPGGGLVERLGRGAERLEEVVLEVRFEVGVAHLQARCRFEVLHAVGKGMPRLAVFARKGVRLRGVHIRFDFSRDAGFGEIGKFASVDKFIFSLLLVRIDWGGDDGFFLAIVFVGPTVIKLQVFESEVHRVFRGGRGRGGGGGLVTSIRTSFSPTFTGSIPEGFAVVVVGWGSGIGSGSGTGTIVAGSIFGPRREAREFGKVVGSEVLHETRSGLGDLVVRAQLPAKRAFNFARLRGKTKVSGRIRPHQTFGPPGHGNARRR